MDGKQAIDAIQAQEFDLALCDIMLPELDGFELLRYMKGKGIPVIYVSAKADVQSRVQGLRLGAEDYLIKPSDILELLVRMEKVLARTDRHPKLLAYKDISVDEESHAVTKTEKLFLSNTWNMNCYLSVTFSVTLSLKKIKEKPP